MTHSRAMTSHHNVEWRYQRVLGLMDDVAAQSGDRLPIFATPVSCSWQWSRRGSWLGGFWGAAWWLRARLAEAGAAEYAEAIQRRLEPQLEADSVHRAMIFWYGAGLGSLWCGHPPSESLMRDALAVLLASYNNHYGCFPLGSGLGAGEQGAKRVSVDSLSSLVALVQHGGDRSALDNLHAHIDTLRHHCALGKGLYRAQGALSGDDDVKRPWPRGQAWTMLGLVRAAEIWPEPFASDAMFACNGWWRRWAHRIPLQDAGEQTPLPDASASLMAGLAMLKGQYRLGWNAVWRSRANTLIETALQSPAIGSLDQQLPAALFSPYRVAPGNVALVQTPWTLFFSLLALAFQTGRLSLHDVVEVI